MNAQAEMLPAMKSASRTIRNSYKGGHVHADMLDEAAASLADLAADVRQARAALSQNATFPADIDLARRALDRALARLGKVA